MDRRRNYRCFTPPWFSVLHPTIQELNLLRLMPLTKQGDELVHAIGQGGRDEAEAGCVTVDQLRISTWMLECLLEVFLSPGHSSLKDSDTLHRTFDQNGVILSNRILMNHCNNLNLIVKGCRTDEVRYRVISVLILTLLKDSLLLRGETDIVEIYPAKIYTSFQIFSQTALQHTQRPFLLRDFFNGYFPTRNYN